MGTNTQILTRTNDISIEGCNRLPFLPDFGYNNYVARKHGCLSRNVQGELEAALFFQ
jgi:hypothetical protein